MQRLAGRHVGQLRDAEVEQLHEVATPSPGGEEDVRRFQIAMHDARVVNDPEPFADLRRDAQRTPEGRHPLGLGELVEAHALEQLHDVVLLRVGAVEEVGDLDDVLVRDLIHRPRFAEESLQVHRVRGALRPEHLQRNPPPQSHMLGAIHTAHAAFAEQIDDLVGAENCPRKRHLTGQRQQALVRAGAVDRIRVRFGVDVVHRQNLTGPASRNRKTARLSPLWTLWRCWLTDFKTTWPPVVARPRGRPKLIIGAARHGLDDDGGKAAPRARSHAEGPKPPTCR